MTSDELRLAAEYNRGYEDGKRAKSAEERRLDFERSKVIQELEKLALDGDLYANMSAICGCVFTSEFGWTRGDCGALRDMLVGLLGGGNGTVGLLDRDENGTCPDVNETCPNDVQTASNDTEQSPNVTENEPNLTELFGFKPEGGWKPLPIEIGEVTEETSTASEHSITTELREWAGFFIVDGSLLKSINDIADRIDEQFARICEQQESVLQSTIDYMEVTE